MRFRPLAAAAVAILGAALAAQAQEPTVAVDLGGGVRLDLVLVKAGQFVQGSPASEAGRGADEASRPVKLTRDFYIGKHPVTVGQFSRFVAETKFRTDAEKGQSGGSGFDGTGLVQRPEFNWRNPGFAQDDSHPVVIVTYDDALAFTQWLGRKASRTVSLPTEAQWERACRAGTQGRFYRGTKDADVVQIAWVKANAGSGTRPVGQKRENAFSLFDMSGNVYEWVQDWYGPYPPGAATDPLEARQTLSDKPRRGLRGGSWLKEARYARCAARYRNTPGSRNADNGFRVAASVEKATPPPPAPPAPLVGAGASDHEIGVGDVLGVLLEYGTYPLIVLGVGILALRLGHKAWSRSRRKNRVRTRTVEDGFWIYAPDDTRGQTIAYSARVGGQEQPGSMSSPGESGEFVYTGGRVEAVRIVGLTAAASSLGAVSSATDTRSDSWNDRSDSSRFSGFPSAY